MDIVRARVLRYGPDTEVLPAPSPAPSGVPRGVGAS